MAKVRHFIKEINYSLIVIVILVLNSMFMTVSWASAIIFLAVTTWHISSLYFKSQEPIQMEMSVELRELTDKINTLRMQKEVTSLQVDIARIVSAQKGETSVQTRKVMF